MGHDPKVEKRCIFAALALALFAAALDSGAQSRPAGAPPAAAVERPAPVAEKPAPAAAVPAIPLAEMASRAEEDVARVREIRDSLASNRSEQTITAQLGNLRREIDVRLAENRRILSRTSSIDTLRRIDAPWLRLARTLNEWSRTLSRRIVETERDLAMLQQLRAAWSATEEEARKSAAPAEVPRRIQAVVAQIDQVREALTREHSRALSVQARVAAQQGRIADIIAANRRARQDLEENLLVRDGAAIWNLTAAEAQGIAAESQNALSVQRSAVRAYGERHAGSLLFHGMIFLALVAILYRARARLRSRARDEPALAECAEVFEMPVAMALLLAIIGGFRIYPDAPTLWLAILGALGLVPAIVILRRLMERDVLPVMYAVVIFYFVDRVRSVAAPLALVPRLLFVAELLCAAAVAAWLAIAMRRTRPDGHSGRRRKYIRTASYVALAGALAAAAANALGYVALSALLGNAVLASAYVALILYAIVEILDGLFVLALHLRPLALLASVRNHRPMLARRMRRAMEWIAVVLWILFALQRLALRERLFQLAGGALAAELEVGSIHASLGDVLAFALSVWAAFLLSRLVRFLLDEELYPRFSLAHGLPYAISATLHYLILVAGFLIAVGALGLDMTKFTILAGAFTVGVGFGLQNIFNNFVSGLILLYERPIKVGDLIQIGEEHGVVERIGIRASIVRASNGAQLIVPNGKLISDQVVNWTLYYRRCSVEVPIAVASLTDYRKALDVLERVARENPSVLKDPAPKALVARTGPDWWNLVLQVWTDRPEQWMDIRSDLAVAAAAALRAEGVAIK